MRAARCIRRSSRRPFAASCATRFRLSTADAHRRRRSRGRRLLLDLIAGLQRSGTITVARMCSTCRFFRPDAHPGAVERHHCALVDIPMSDGQLRVDCAEHAPADARTPLLTKATGTYI